MENEKKYVVSSYRELETKLTPFGWHDIQQGYLDPSNRLRRITYDNGARDHLFTYKKRLAQGHNLEIESTIAAALFDEAWDHTIERLVKRRISVEHGDLKWDIDFYRWRHGKYFVLAEVEMPPHMTHPEAILPDLIPYMVYEVPRDDDRFAARRLADEDHVRQVAHDLGLL